MGANIRSIQHFLYCPRRYALLEINQDWAENAFVVKANLMHERVHEGDHAFTNKNKTVLSSVAVYHDGLDLYGVTDCMEFEADRKGCFVPMLGGNYRVKIVEYKPRMPEDGGYSEADAIQVFAQKVCADEIWQCRSEAYLYYADVRRRVRLPFEEEYEAYWDRLTSLLDQMRRCKGEGRIPPRRKGQNCGGCSLKDVCMPNGRGEPTKTRIMRLLEAL